MRQEHSAYFEERAKDLLAGKDAVIETTEGTIRARLVRFRNGAVFENWHTSGHGTGHGMARIERQHLSDPVGVLVSYLVNAVVDLGMDVEVSRICPATETQEVQAVGRCRQQNLLVIGNLRPLSDIPSRAG